MKKKIRHNDTAKAICLLAGAMCASTAYSADVSGLIYDQINGQYLNGCEIKILENGQTVYTQRGGSYTIYALNPGTYTIEARAIGLPVTTRVVTITENDTNVLLNIYITDEEVFDLEPVTVVGSLVGRAKALNIQKSSDNLVDVVSADAMGQFVDRNAAEALQRQPGVTVIDDQGEGKYIVIRGASPSWNQVMIDGVNVATPEENGRTTALDIISTDQLESIEVTKTWTPDKPVGSIGGTVNLITRSALDRNERFASLEGAIGFYDYSDSMSWRYNMVYGDVIRLGRDDRKLGIQVSYNQSEDSRGSQTLGATNWTANTTPDLQGATPSGFSLKGLEFQDYSIDRDRIAVGSKIEFQLNENNTFFASASFNRYNDTETLQELQLNATTDSSVSYRGSLYFNEKTAVALGYDLNDPDVQKRLSLPSGSSEKRLSYTEAENLGEIYFNPESKNYEKYIAAGDTQKRFEQVDIDDRIETYQLGGKHNLFDGFTVDYKVYTSRAKKEWTKNGLYFDSPELSFVVELDPTDGYSPNMRVNNSLDQLADPEIYLLNRSHGMIYDYKYFSDDKRNGFESNAKYTYELFGIPCVTTIGAAGDFREKEYRRNFTRYGDIELEGLDQLTLADEYFAGDTHYTFFKAANRSYELGPMFDEKNTLDFLHHTPDSVKLIQRTDDVNYNVTDAVLKNYRAEEDITAAYLMQKMSFGKWEVLGGFRWEHTKNGFENNIINTDLDGTFILPGYWQYLDQDLYCEWVRNDRDYDNVLPALLIKREFGDSWVLRSSFTQSIARPTFTDLIPFELVDIDGAMFGRKIRLPNFDLKPMESVNYDISIEKYLKGVGMIAVNPFYKDLDGAIYEQTRSDVAAGDDPRVNYYAHKYIASDIEANASTWTTTQMVNSGKGRLYGVEFSYDTKLSFLPTYLEGFGFSSNYTLVNSEVELLLAERYKEKVPLFQQAKQSGNFSFYYERFGFLARLSYVWRGKYLDSVQAGDTTINNLIKAGEKSNAFDTYADDHQRLDLLMRYKFNEHLNFFVEATNLTNEPIRFYRGDASRLSSIRYTGTTWFVGAKMSL